MKKAIVAALALVMAITLSIAGCKNLQRKPIKPSLQVTCPIVGGKINKELYADYKGKRVYFCCAGCIEKFKNAPEKYIKKLEDMGITIERTPQRQTRCPVMGGEINKEVFYDYKGKRIYFCCPGCIKKFKENPEKYMKKLEDTGVTLEETP